MHDTFELRQYAVVNDKFYLVGFVPRKSLDKFIKHFEDLPGVAIKCTHAELDQRYEPPIKLKNNWFSKPFVMFVEMYGLPSYNGINPTNFVAITYTLIFGIMFGDLGQGLVLALALDFVLQAKENHPGQVLVRAGFSSAFFGLIYGSVLALRRHSIHYTKQSALKKSHSKYSTA